MVSQTIFFQVLLFIIFVFACCTAFWYNNEHVTLLNPNKIYICDNNTNCIQYDNLLQTLPSQIQPIFFDNNRYWNSRTHYYPRHHTPRRYTTYRHHRNKRVL